MKKTEAKTRARSPKRRVNPQLVFLAGFMGAGKSSVGEALAEKLGWRFIDLDGRIEARQKMRIAEMFRELGEEEFRRAEHEELRQVMKEAEEEGAAVVALGGGTFVQAHNAKLLDGGCCIFLEAPVDELWRRAQAETGKRPLAISENHFRQLYEERRPRYMEADHQVHTGGRTVREVAAEIAMRLQLGSNQGERE